MTKTKKKNKSLLIIIFLTIACISIYFVILNKKSTNEVLSKINGYEYFISENDSSLTKKLYDELNKVLTNSSIDYEEYAKLISEMFIVDLYTLTNKNSKYSVSSKIYFYPAYRDNFSLKVKDTMYKYLPDIKNKPEVTSTEVTECTTENFVINDKNYEGYVVKLNWNYDKDYGYDNSGKISIIKDNNKLYIISYEGEEAI